MAASGDPEVIDVDAEDVIMDNSSVELLIGLLDRF